MIQYKFTDRSKSDFERDLKKKVNDYFKSNDLSKKSNGFMFFKSLFFFCFYASVYIAIVKIEFSSISILLLLSVLLGFGHAFSGMNIMHDFVHGTYKKNKIVEVLLNTFLLLIGVNSFIWSIEHNVIHHTYTNIDGVDQDINNLYIFRFSEIQPKKWFHKYQYLYASIIYCFAIIDWQTSKDFLKLYRYYRDGYFKSRGEMILMLMRLILEKVIFYLLFFVIPYYAFNQGWQTPTLMLITMMLSSSLVIALVFRLAHVVPCTSLADSKESDVYKNWFIHQIESSSNFANGNSLVTFLTGGLNFQIEHHLFPNICHVHYPVIATLVRETANEYGIKYNSYYTVSDAVKAHFRLLKDMGVKS